MLGLHDTSALSKWEHGICYPNLLQVFRLARIYQIPPHELFAELWHHTGTEKHLLANDDEPLITNSSFSL